MARPPRILELSDSQIAEIRQFLKKTKDVREYRRALAVLYNVRDRKPSSEIASIMGTIIRSISRWLTRYMKKGIEGFKEGKRTGRKSKVTKK